MNPRLETANYLAGLSLVESVFGKDLTLFRSVNEVFELELAFMEMQSLKREELVSRAAYFLSIDGELSNHYRLCSGFGKSVAQNRSAQVHNYFQEGKFATGYATHGLFPYRGKFHPQLIKALLNVLNVKPGETVLDPMCGSGTVAVETAILGINSLSFDVSPFCNLMTQVKCQSLTLSPELLTDLPLEPEKWMTFFDGGKVNEQFAKVKEQEKYKVYQLVLLAYLDAMGYARRVNKATHLELFAKVLRRYQGIVKETVQNPVINQNRLGKAEAFVGDARHLPLDDASVDCVITSPPYSFAIDYADNDALQLEFLGYDVKALRNQMLGLWGKRKADKLKNYFDDMKLVVEEIARVLKPGRHAVFIIGSNTNQTGGIRLEQTVIDHFAAAGAPLVRSILKPIKGMHNTMKEEYILFFQKA